MASEKKTRRKHERIPVSQEQLRKTQAIVDASLKDNPDMFNLPASKHSVELLTDYFVKTKADTTRILPKEKRRYVIYCRKSTDDESKQVRSLDDQEKECLELAEQLDIKVRKEDIFRESASAKKSGKRPIFDHIIEGFQTNKYHGLLTWSPDRLSRNMKEGGEIIELVDLERIQDLHFKTYQFENTPNGKMLLGILFATSKQYSDKLSVDVNRGITGNITEGKYNGSVKKGYYANPDTGYFEPDSLNWHLIRRAVVMRAYEGKTNQQIADWLNASHLSVRRNRDDTPKLAKMSKKTVGDTFADPFYCGVYHYGERIANLNELYDFMPLMTTDEYVTINRATADTFNEKYVGRATKSTKLDFGVLREKVICDYCDTVMEFQRQLIKKGKNKGSYTIRYYCRNRASCERHLKKDESIAKYGKVLPKSVRLKTIAPAIENTLRHLTKNTVEAHKRYIERLEQQIIVDKAIAERKLRQATTDVKKQQVEYDKYLNLHLNHTADYNKYHKGKLEQTETLLNAYRATQEQAKKDLVKLKEPLPTREQFVELVNSYLKIATTTQDLVEEDAVYNEVVLNLRVRDDVVSVIKLNPPYDLMVDLEKITFGARERT